MMKIIEQNISRIIELCRRFGVKKLYVFGSILTDRFNEQSDVDFLFNFNDSVSYHDYADCFFGLHDGLRRLFGRNIDLVDESAIKNKYFREEVEETRQLIYG